LSGHSPEKIAWTKSVLDVSIVPAATAADQIDEYPLWGEYIAAINAALAESEAQLQRSTDKSMKPGALVSLRNLLKQLARKERERNDSGYQELEKDNLIARRRAAQIKASVDRALATMPKYEQALAYSLACIEKATAEIKKGAAPLDQTALLPKLNELTVRHDMCKDMLSVTSIEGEVDSLNEIANEATALAANYAGGVTGDKQERGSLESLPVKQDGDHPIAAATGNSTGYQKDSWYVSDPPTAQTGRDVGTFPVDNQAHAPVQRSPDDKPVDQRSAVERNYKRLLADSLKAIEEAAAEIKGQPIPALQKNLQSKLEHLTTKHVELRDLTDPEEIEKSIELLRDIRKQAYAIGDKFSRSAIGGSVKHLFVGIQELRAFVESNADLDAKADILSQLDGFGDRIAYDAVPKRGQLSAREHTLAHAHSFSAFELAVRAPKSPEREMMNLLGPKEFAERLTSMYHTAVKLGAHHKPLSAGEAVSINAYMDEQYYKKMNGLNFGTFEAETVQERDFLVALNEKCMAALAKLPDYPETAWPTARYERTWVPDPLQNRYVQGNNFKAVSFWSTSAGRAVDTMRRSPPPRFHFKVYGKSGKDVAAMAPAALAGEGGIKTPQPAGQGKGEVLFAPGTQFNVEQRSEPQDPLGRTPTYEFRVREV
jgi:hypothetical protein